MAICPQCSDFLKPSATQCPECGWGTPAHSAKPARERETNGTAWSPPTPKYTGEPWEGRTPLTPEEAAPYLAKLREIGTSNRQAGAAIVTPDRTAAYLAACRRTGKGKPEALEALGPVPDSPLPTDLSRVVSRMTTARREFHRELATMFPVTEAEERAASRVEAER